MAIQSWISRLIPTDRAYDALFGQFGRLFIESAEILRSLENGTVSPADASTQLAAIEQRADSIARDIYAAVPRSLVHPFDPEDMYRLVRELDAVIDATEGTVNRIVMYDVTAFSARFREALRGLCDGCVALSVMIDGLLVSNQTAPGRVDAEFLRVREIEQRVDQLLGEELYDLFHDASDWRKFFSRKEVFGRLEQAVDHCHRSACILHEVIALNG